MGARVEKGEEGGYRAARTESAYAMRISGNNEDRKQNKPRHKRSERERERVPDR